MRRFLSTRTLVSAAVLLTCGWFAFSMRGAGAETTDPPPAAAPAEPITGSPSTPEPGDEAAPLDPFAPTPTHPGDVPIEDLTAEEQAVAERGLGMSGWAETHAGFASATQAAAERARAEAAANAVGLEGLGTVGVVTP